MNRLQEAFFIRAGRSRARLAGPTLALVGVGMLTHVAVVFLSPRSILPSNLLQLFFPLLAVAVSLDQRSYSTNAVGTRCWSAVAAAFGIWATAQALYIYFLYWPVFKIAGVRADDALWVLFGLPLLLAVHTTHEEIDSVQWLDRLQAVFFFIVLYLLVFVRPVRFTISRAYLIQNVALLLCCLLRLPICTRARERRFFMRLTIFLLIYGVSETVGELLYVQGWHVGSPVDLIWTLPAATFLALIALDARTSTEEEMHASRLVTAVSRMRGLSIATLTFLCLGVSALVATRSLLLGAICVVCCFALFALRTNAREHAWDEAHSQLEETVLQDALTGLGNRIQLRRSLEERLSIGSPETKTALLFVDLDRFKSINDTLGHALGDRLLIEVARRLREAAPVDSQVCRIGGDEFIVLATARSEAQAEAAAQVLLDSLRVPYHLGEQILRCNASIGIVLAMPGQVTDDLIRTADHAMYRAKQLGKDRVQLFDDELLTQINHRWRLESDLRTAIDRNEIQIAFQPILSVATGEISGFEALARWSHPTHGNVPPTEFIALAESSGRIFALGTQVLEKACRQVAAWNLAWETQYSVSVNVSPRQFAESGFVALVLATLHRAGLAPQLLQLEITESVLMVHEDTVKDVLSEARAHGIRISLDDFGTGYSSLSFLLNLPVDEVKVDRSFVSDMHRDPQRRELVGMVIQLSHSLGKKVVAEGVETQQELGELAAMGCERAQGWLISRPLLAEALQEEMPAITARSARCIREFRLSVDAAHGKTRQADLRQPSRSLIELQTAL